MVPSPFLLPSPSQYASWSSLFLRLLPFFQLIPSWVFSLSSSLSLAIFTVFSSESRTLIKFVTYSLPAGGFLSTCPTELKSTSELTSTAPLESRVSWRNSFWCWFVLQFPAFLEFSAYLLYSMDLQILFYFLYLNQWSIEMNKVPVKEHKQWTIVESGTRDNWWDEQGSSGANCGHGRGVCVFVGGEGGRRQIQQ